MRDIRCILGFHRSACTDYKLIHCPYWDNCDIPEHCIDRFIFSCSRCLKFLKEKRFNNQGIEIHWR